MGTNCSNCASLSSDQQNPQSNSCTSKQSLTDSTKTCAESNLNNQPLISQTLDKCNLACSYLNNCSGVIYDTTAKTCYLKSSNFKNTQCPSFYVKNVNTNTNVPDSVNTNYTVQTNHCTGTDIVFVVPENKNNCMATCNEFAECKGVHYNDKHNLCMMLNTITCDPATPNNPPMLFSKIYLKK